MGCRQCISGLGEYCEGPSGLYTEEIDCGCACHVCQRCGSAYCMRVGGPYDCDSPCLICGLPAWECDCIEDLYPGYEDSAPVFDDSMVGVRG